MNKLTAFILSGVFFSISAHAYQDGVYKCKNPQAGLPTNTFKVETITVGGAALPYVEMTQYYTATDAPNAPVIESHLKGFASVMTDSDGNELLQLVQRQMEFESGHMKGCQL